MIRESIIIRLGVKFSALTSTNPLIALTSRLAAIGIALGVATLITVLSVMRGFESEIRSTLVQDFDHLHVYAFTDHYPKSFIEELNGLAEVKSAKPFYKGYALMRGLRVPKPVMLLAFDDPSIQDGGVYLSGDDDLYFQQGLEISLVTADNQSAKVLKPIYLGSSPINIAPKGMMTALCSLKTYQSLTDNTKYSGLFLVVDDIYATEAVRSYIKDRYSGLYYTFDWKDKYQPLFSALRMQRSLMLFVLSMIILVAMFSKVSGLVMMSSDKMPQIALLRTMGMSRLQIKQIFILQGVVITGVGVIMGVLLALILCTYATEITVYLENILGMTLVDPRVYGVSTLPVLLDYYLVLSVAAIALLIGVLASIYPASKASKLDPAQVLRYV